MFPLKHIDCWGIKIKADCILLTKNKPLYKDVESLKRKE